MLAYWYNAPRHIKLIFIIVVCTAIYAANQVQPLSPTYTVLSLVLGFGLHFGQYLQTKFQSTAHINLSSRICLNLPSHYCCYYNVVTALNTIGLQEYKL